MLETVFFWVIILIAPQGWTQAYALTDPYLCQQTAQALQYYALYTNPGTIVSPCNPVKVVDSEWEPRPGDRPHPR